MHSDHGEGNVWLKIDDRRVEVPARSSVLAAARKLGIDVPTLCDHPDLDPVGACRLCMVEVTHPKWSGWKRLVTSCLYPVEDGLEVSTRSDAVRVARRGVLALLAARCPGSATIRALAERHGATSEGLRSSPDADDCIVCGSCARVCEAFATSAIATVGRGTDKQVSGFAHGAPADCMGCGGCAIVCPTGAIFARRDGDGYHIWDRTFPAAVCTVDAERCIACGSCADACPFAVARVALGRGGAAHAVIAPEHCRGCGACVGACPTGAVEQQGFAAAQLLRPSRSAASPAPDAGVSATVIACDRAALGPYEPDAQGRLPELEPRAGTAPSRPELRVVELPCTGRVSVPMLLAELAAGADALLVLGRNERTCRLGGAEASARHHVARARQLLALLGLDPARIAFELPAAGPTGPRSATVALEARAIALGRLDRPDGHAPQLEREDLDGALAQLRWLSSASAVTSARPASDGTSVADTADSLTGWLRLHGLPLAASTEPGVVVGELAWLELLAAPWLPLRPPLGLARMALEVLHRLGHSDAGIATAPAQDATVLRLALGPLPTGAPLTQASAHSFEGARPMDDWLCEQAGAFEHVATGARVATDGSAAAARLVATLGLEPLDVGPDPLPDRFSFSNAHRSAAVERLALAHHRGADVLLVADPRAWLRTALLIRTGSWRASPVVPVLGVELALGALTGRVARWQSVEAPLRRPAAPDAMEVLV